MNFKASGHLTYQVNGPATVITSLHCMQTARQQVSEESFLTSKSIESFDEMSVGFGQNRFARLILSEPGEISLDYSARVQTSPRLVPQSELYRGDVEPFAQEVVPYLFPSRYCQSDMLREKAALLFPPQNTIYERANLITDWISKNISYVSGSTDEQSSALDVLEQRVGLCSSWYRFLPGAHHSRSLHHGLCLPTSATRFSCLLRGLHQW
jgi:hypothetical protein